MKRVTVVIAYLAIYAGIVLYHYTLKRYNLSDSGLLYIGLPALLAILVLQIPSKSITGRLLIGLTLVLLLAVPVLREGTVCVIMSAPLMYAVVAAIGLLFDWVAQYWNRTNASILVTCLAVVLSMEGVTEATTFNRNEIVVTSRIIDGTPAEVMSRFTVDPTIPTELPRLFDIGFPRPYAFKRDGDEIGSHFSLFFIKNEKISAVTFELAEATPDRLVFTMVEDKSRVSRWMSWQKTAFTFRPTQDGRTEVICAISFWRRLDPVWYFGPIERYAVGLVGDMLLDHFATAPSPLVGSL